MTLIDKKTQSVLVVDDDLSVVELFKEALEDLSLHVYTATSGQEALVFLDKNKVNCIVTDVAMPEMDGIEFIELIHARGDHTPFFFITGYLDYSRESLNDLKPRAIMFKPFDFEEAAMLVKNHLMRIS